MITKEEHIKESMDIYLKSGYNKTFSKKMAISDWKNFKKSKIYEIQMNKECEKTLGKMR